MKIVVEIRCSRTKARLEILEGTDEYSDGQPHSQHVRILDRGKTLSYLLPRLSRLEPRAVVLPILLLHATRHLGLMFLAPGAVYPGIPQQFAVPAAFGDLVAAVLALIAIPAVVNRSPLARPLVGLFNIEGTFDLIAAITLATVAKAAPFMGPAYWIPAFWVPALLITHYIVFVLLGRRWTGPM
jgi:hypothetical protein